MPLFWATPETAGTEAFDLEAGAGAVSGDCLLPLLFIEMPLRSPRVELAAWIAALSDAPKS